MSELVLQHLSGKPELPGYASALDLACRENPPPYSHHWFAQHHHRLARDPSWFASLLVSDVDLEGYSARQLWAYAGLVADPSFARGLRHHAADESRHSRMFAGLLFAIFPELKTDDLVCKLREMAPTLRLRDDVLPSPIGQPAAPDEVLNAAILINLHEVKALLLEYMLRPVLLAYAPPEQRHKVATVADAIIADEVRHIHYSAEYIEKAISGGDRSHIADAMVDFQQMMNTVTLEEIENATCHTSAQTADLVFNG